MGRSSTTLKGPSLQDLARSWPAHAMAIHTMANIFPLEYAGETLNPKSYGGGVPTVLRRGCRGQGQHDVVGPWPAGPGEGVAGTCEGFMCEEMLNFESYEGGSPQCFAEVAVGKGSTMW